MQWAGILVKLTGWLVGIVLGILSWWHIGLVAYWAGILAGILTGILDYLTSQLEYLLEYFLAIDCQMAGIPAGNTHGLTIGWPIATGWYMC